MTLFTRLALAVLATIIFGIAAFQTPLLTHARHLTWDAVTRTVGRLAGLRHLKLDDKIGEEIAFLRSENIRLQSELEEYSRLKAQLSTPTVDNKRHVLASITGPTTDPWQTKYAINRGARHGLSLGDPAVVYGNILIGTIAEITDQTAIIQTIPHPETAIPAEILETSDSRGLLVGITHTGATLSTIPRSAEISPGKPVITQGTQLMPHGLVIGTVRTVHREENEAYQEVNVKLAADTAAIKAVIILATP